jgi:hypothetical protein
METLSGYDVYKIALNWLISLPNDDAFVAMANARQMARVKAWVAQAPQDVVVRQEGTQIVVAAVLIGAGRPV